MLHFSEHLKRKGLKLTNQRLQVAKKIFELDSHFTIEALADSLRLSPQEKENISRATVYRMVSVMMEAGLLAEHYFGQNAKFYEYTGRQKHHDHIICMDCGYIEEFCSNRIEKIQSEIVKQHGFDLENHALTLYGRCRSYKEKGQCRHYTAPDNSN